MTVFDRYLEQAKDFTRKLVRAETGTRRWATVTSVDPVRITYDGTTTQGIISPVVLGTPVTLGDRVRAHTIGGQTYITRANPTRDPGLPFAMAAGLAYVSNISGGSGDVTVQFPPGRFSVTPIITATADGNNVTVQNVSVYGRSLSGFSIKVLRSNNNNTYVYWQAVQMTPTSAEG